MDCVGCKSAMITFEFQGVEIDQCQACQGLWLDAGELETLLGRKSLETHALNLKKNRHCPICSAKMEKIHAGADKVELDRCPKRHGIWCDGGEFPHLLQSARSSGMGERASIFSEVFQKHPNQRS